MIPAAERDYPHAPTVHRRRTWLDLAHRPHSTREHWTGDRWEPCLDPAHALPHWTPGGCRNGHAADRLRHFGEGARARVRCLDCVAAREGA